MTRSGLSVCLLVAAAPVVVAQAPAVKRAAATITEADIRRRIFIIADDSMGGRNTPSPGLTKTANYIADEFRRFGLKPGGDSGSFLLHYPIERRRVIADRSTLRIASTTGGASATISFQDGAALAFTTAAKVPVKGVADLNADMIGRNWKDTIVAIGKEHSDLGATLNRVNAAHPELKMIAIDDRWPQESFYTRSDHYNFARKDVPILFFFNGVHEDYHQASDSPDKIDAEKESRVVRLLYYVGQEVANAAERPKWRPSIPVPRPSRRSRRMRKSHSPRPPQSPARPRGPAPRSAPLRG